MFLHLKASRVGYHTHPLPSIPRTANHLLYRYSSTPWWGTIQHCFSWSSTASLPSQPSRCFDIFRFSRSHDRPQNVVYFFLVHTTSSLCELVSLKISSIRFFICPWYSHHSSLTPHCHQHMFTPSAHQLMLQAYDVWVHLNVYFKIAIVYRYFLHNYF